MRLLLTFIISFTLFFAQAQLFPTEIIQNNGPEDKRINILVMGDGFLESEQDAFTAHAENIITKLFQESPYREYENFFNAIIIKVPSTESGTDHPATANDESSPPLPVTSNQTYFEGTFDGHNIHRLTIIANNAQAFSVAASNFPSYDQILMLLNSPNYGGSGGSISVLSVHNQSAEVGIHEMGHSFANLIDEYWAGDQYAVEGINMTQETDPDQVKWKSWINTNGIGIYQHSGGGMASEWYRPHQNCKMRALNNPFCNVCIEGTIDKIYSLTSPIDDFSPNENTQTFSGDALEFSLDLVLPQPNTLETTWTLDGVEIGTNLDHITIDNFPQGESILTATVKDATTLSHKTSGYTFSTIWKINNNTVSLMESNTKLFYKVFPNPTNDVLFISFDGDFPTQETVIHLVSPTGQIIFSKRKQLLIKSTLQIDVSKFPKGNYILKIERGSIEQTVPVVLR